MMLPEIRSAVLEIDNKIEETLGTTAMAVAGIVAIAAVGYFVYKVVL